MHQGVESEVQRQKEANQKNVTKTEAGRMIETFFQQASHPSQNFDPDRRVPVLSSVYFNRTWQNSGDVVLCMALTPPYSHLIVERYETI